MSNGLPSAPGVLLAGFHYQYLFAWKEALELLREGGDVVGVTVEVSGVGNVDDVVVERSGQPDVYHQVKYAVDASTPLSTEWLTTVPGGSIRSVLQKLRDAHDLLVARGDPFEMVLQTNRLVDPADALLAGIDGRDGKLVPRIEGGGPASRVGRARREWADHLHVDERQLLDMLGHLSFHVASGSIDALSDATGELMRFVGLRGEREDVDRAVAALHRRLIAGRHVLDADSMRELIDQEGLQRAERRSTLLIQAIDARPWAEAATTAVDWVELFVGDEPRARRALRDPADWNGRLRPELQAAVRQLRAVGPRSVQVEGALRLSTWFLAGVELGGTAGFDVSTVAYGEEWSSAQAGEPMALQATEHPVGKGSDLAVGLSVTGDLTSDVMAYLRASAAPVDRLLELRPAGGLGRAALSAGTAAGWAQAALEAVRDARGEAERVHLFLFAPGGAALLLGHLWNRVPTTQLYDDLNRPGSYTPTFTLPA